MGQGLHATARGRCPTDAARGGGMRSPSWSLVQCPLGRRPSDAARSALPSSVQRPRRAATSQRCPSCRRVTAASLSRRRRVFRPPAAPAVLVCTTRSRRYRCSRCAELVVASKRLTLHTLPNVLTVGAQCHAGGLSLGLPLLPHLHRDWAHPCHTCTATAARASAVLSGTRACNVLTPLVLRRGGWLWLLTRTGPRAVHTCAGHGAVLFQTTPMGRSSGSAYDCSTNMFDTGSRGGCCAAAPEAV